MSNSTATLISQVSIPPISWRRRVTDRVMTGIAVLTVLLVLVPLFAIFAYLVYKGIGSINLAFLTQTPKPVGEPGGGMANAIAGSMVILPSPACSACRSGSVRVFFSPSTDGTAMAISCALSPMC